MCGCELEKCTECGRSVYNHEDTCSQWLPHHLLAIKNRANVVEKTRHLSDIEILNQNARGK